MLKAGDTVFGGKLVIVEISDDCRVFVVQSKELGDPTGPAEIRFRAGDTVDMINAFFGLGG